jgi:hypothetical protein
LIRLTESSRDAWSFHQFDSYTTHSYDPRATDALAAGKEIHPHARACAKMCSSDVAAGMFLPEADGGMKGEGVLTLPSYLVHAMACCTIQDMPWTPRSLHTAEYYGVTRFDSLQQKVVAGAGNCALSLRLVLAVSRGGRGLRVSIKVAAARV